MSLKNYVTATHPDGRIEFLNAESKWLHFRRLKTPKGNKTAIVNVLAKDGLIVIGQVRWYNTWRKYTFQPREHTVYEVQCLLDIADFIEVLTKDHRATILWRKQKALVAK